MQLIAGSRSQLTGGDSSPAKKGGRMSICVEAHS